MDKNTLNFPAISSQLSRVDGVTIGQDRQLTMKAKLETTIHDGNTFYMHTHAEAQQKEGPKETDQSQEPEVSVALSRSIPSPSAQSRPNSLTVRAQPSKDDGVEEEKFQSSEEERTPEGGRQEFIGHEYKSPRVNNGEIVTPEMTPPPLNMVGGEMLFMRCYRRQYSDNNCHRLSEEHNAIVVQGALRRQRSEPVEELQRQQHSVKDNNGHPIIIIQD